MPTPPATNTYGAGPTPPRPQVQSPTIWVERTFPTGEQFEEKNLEARVFATQPAVVTAKLGKTINLGNYESIRIEVGVSLPCYAEEVEQGINVAAEICGRHIAEEEAAARQLMARQKKSA